MPLLQRPPHAEPVPAVAPSCPDCAEAERRHCWCAYTDGCPGCTARAIARGLDAFNALHPNGTGEREPLRELIARLMPGDYTKARHSVWRWWQHDHPEAKVYAP